MILDRWIVLDSYRVRHLRTRRVRARCWAGIVDCGTSCPVACHGHQCRQPVALPPTSAAKSGLCVPCHDDRATPPPDPRLQSRARG